MNKKAKDKEWNDIKPYLKINKSYREGLLRLLYIECALVDDYTFFEDVFGFHKFHKMTLSSFIKGYSDYSSEKVWYSLYSRSKDVKKSIIQNLKIYEV